MRLKPFRLWLYRLLVHNLPETRCFGLKVCFLRWCGAQIGENVRINSSARISGTGQLSVGDDVWIGAGSRIVATEKSCVNIGAHVDIGPEVMIITGTHEITPNDDHIAAKGCSMPVEIGSGCWLGARATILPGVSIAEKCVVAAGSVVTKSCERSYSLLAGVPALAKKSLS